MTQSMAGSPAADTRQPDDPSAAPGDVAERAKHATDELRSQAGEVTQDVRSQARHLIERTREEAVKEASDRTSQFAGTLHGLADELRTMARADQDGRLSAVASGAADRAERFAGRLDDRGAEGLVVDVKQAVRRRPGLVLAAAVAAGFVVGRLVREGAHVATSQSGTSGGGNGATSGYLQDESTSRASIEGTGRA
jgi:hypothetical protein